MFIKECSGEFYTKLRTETNLSVIALASLVAVLFLSKTFKAVSLSFSRHMRTGFPYRPWSQKIVCGHAQ